jgi:hypothetical protein
LKNDKADHELIKLILEDAISADHLNATYQQISKGVLEQGGSRALEILALDLKKINSKFLTEYDVLRINLGTLYGKTFPTLEDTSNDKSDDKGAIAKSDEKKSDAPESGSSEKLNEERLWTSATGKFQIKAKCIGVDKDKGLVKLQKPDGGVISVKIALLSDKDRELIEASK